MSEYNELNIPTKYWVIIGLIAFILFSGVLGSLWQNAGLKNDIKNREEQIEKIEADKEPILKEIQAMSDEVNRQEAIILALSKKAESLRAGIKKVKDENKRITDYYINSSINERVSIFAELATEQNNAQ
jgi:peptidoglycan hydrolase CwlO-like protein